MECGKEGGRVICEAHPGASEPGPSSFPRGGRPLLRSVALRLSCASGPGQGAWAELCAHSERAGCGGGRL